MFDFLQGVFMTIFEFFTFRTKPEINIRKDIYQEELDNLNLIEPV
jgi:hypothetical protein